MERKESFWSYLKNSLTGHFKDGSWFILLLFLSLSLFINYYFNFEKSVLYSYSSKPFGIVLYFCFYSVAYFPLVIWLLYRSKKLHLLKNKYFLLLSVGVILSLSISATYFYLSPILKLFPNPKTEYLVRKLLVNSRNILLVALPALLIWKYVKEKGDRFFWISFQRIKIKIYLLWLVLPVIIIAFISLTDSFQAAYPTFKPIQASNALNIHRYAWFGLYEFVYGFDFVWVEFLFRGLLILGLFKILGKDVIIPMVSLYCFLHFGKPMGEAISSIAGGYFLGVLALYTRSIAGGSILHIGIAYAMDLFALMWMMIH
jgi:hypothetical protein